MKSALLDEQEEPGRLHAATLCGHHLAGTPTGIVFASLRGMACCQHSLLPVLLLGLLNPGCASDPGAIAGNHPSDSSEIRARVVAAPPFHAADVVIAIDRSIVALAASGIDVDKDGVVGRTRGWVTENKKRLPPPNGNWTTDSDDTIEALQLEVARALVARLAAVGARVGLVSFTLRAWSRGTSLEWLIDEPSVVVPVGSADPVLVKLADFPAVRERRRTDLARLLALAADLLDEASPREPTRPRAILLFSLGEPSAPDGIHWSSRRAVEFASQLGERGIGVWAVPFGTPDVNFLDELTRSSGGEVVPLEQLDAAFSVPGPGAESPRK